MTERQLKSMAVYCGASIGHKLIFKQSAQSLGKVLAEQGIQLVYGAGNVGMMKVVADSVLENGGEVIGVIPKGLADLELQHPHITKCYITDSMQERKFLMRSLADACIALPGGWGTLEEITEFATLSQLNYHNKAVGILNSHGYFDLLLQFLEHAHQEGFVHKSHTDLVQVHTDPATLLQLLRTQNFASIHEQVDDLQRR